MISTCAFHVSPCISAIIVSKKIISTPKLQQLRGLFEGGVLSSLYYWYLAGKGHSTIKQIDRTGAWWKPTHTPSVLLLSIKDVPILKCHFHHSVFTNSQWPALQLAWLALVNRYIIQRYNVASGVIAKVSRLFPVQAWFFFQVLFQPLKGWRIFINSK